MTTSSAMLPRLNAEYLKSNPTLAGGASGLALREKVLQFGEGGFLRGFVDWMIDGMNKQGLFRRLGRGHSTHRPGHGRQAE